MQFTPNLTWDIYNGRRYTVFAPNSRTEFLRFAPGHGIVFETATNTMNRNSPALRMEVLSKTQSYSNGALDSNFIVHKECAFVTPRWCGDGVVDSGESCDSGNQNGQN